MQVDTGGRIFHRAVSFTPFTKPNFDLKAHLTMQPHNKRNLKLYFLKTTFIFPLTSFSTKVINN